MNDAYGYEYEDINATHPLEVLSMAIALLVVVAITALVLI